MSVKTESNRLGDLVKYELEPNFNREIVTVLAGSGADRALTLGGARGTSLVHAGVHSSGHARRYQRA